MRAISIFDQLREQIGRNGAWKSPSPQNEKPILASSVYAQMDPGGMGAAWTTSRSSRTFTGGDLIPQVYIGAQPANIDDILTDSGMVMNNRPALPNRGLTPRSPLFART